RQLPPSDVGRPGRAVGRLPDWVAPGAALAAATARALAVRHGPSDSDDDDSEDDGDSPGPAAAGTSPQDPASVLPRPGSAGGMLPAGRALAAPPARAPAATPTAPQHQDDPGAAQGAEDDRASAASRPADPANDDGRPGRAAGMLPVPVAPGAAQAAATARALAAAYGLDGHAAVSSDDTDAQDDRAAACSPAHVECPPGRLPAGGAPMPSPARASPDTVPSTPSAANFARHAPAAPRSPTHEIFRPGRAGGRLADMPAPGAAPAATAAAIAEAAVAADAAAQAADQVAAQDPVQTTYAHSATEFRCSVCAYVAGNMATLVAHRRSAHRGTRFSDIFDSRCACSLVFHSRVAATSHALA
ncbi:hypothetical protein PR001_g31574, partial [Phytophthora rubi]